MQMHFLLHATTKVETVSVTSHILGVVQDIDLCCTSSGVANLPTLVNLIRYDCDTEAQHWEKDNARWPCSVLERKSSGRSLDRKKSHPQSLTCCAYVRPTEHYTPCALSTNSCCSCTNRSMMGCSKRCSQGPVGASRLKSFDSAFVFVFVLVESIAVS
jgi:hypothetical protein